MTILDDVSKKTEENEFFNGLSSIRWQQKTNDLFDHKIMEGEKLLHRTRRKRKLKRKIFTEGATESGSPIAEK